jgi:polyisoprenoid-binding protein YceI
MATLTQAHGEKSTVRHLTIATSLALALGLAAAPLAPALAQPAAPAASKDPAAAPAGTYNLDTNHSSVVARVAHGGGLSYSTMRFGVKQAVLNWDPANPANIKITATVDAKPHYDPIVYRLAPDAEQLLNAVKWPEATFVSTAVTPTGAAKADVQGNLTLMGQTKPAVMHMELVGAGKNNQGKPVVGFTGTMTVKRSDFGTPFLANAIGNEVTLVLDGEFLGG